MVNKTIQEFYETEGFDENIAMGFTSCGENRAKILKYDTDYYLAIPHKNKYDDYYKLYLFDNYKTRSFTGISFYLNFNEDIKFIGIKTRFEKRLHLGK